MRRRIPTVRLTIAGIAGALVVGVAGSMALGGASPSNAGRQIPPAAFGVPVDRVETVAFDAKSNGVLKSMRAGAAGLDRIATLAGVDFYRTTRDDGAVCFALSSFRGDRSVLGEVACLQDAFVAVPLIDMSGFLVRFSPTGGEQVTVMSVQGFAADEVASVAVLEVDGKSTRTPVVNGAYRMPTERVPSGEVAAIVALDKSQHPVYTKQVSP